jgi:hypothetical protein
VTADRPMWFYAQSADWICVIWKSGFEILHNWNFLSSDMSDKWKFHGLVKMQAYILKLLYEITFRLCV